MAALVVCVACAFEFGLTASAGIIPKHFDAPDSIAFVGNHAFVTDSDSRTITLFNAVTEHFEHVPPTWFRLEAPLQVVSFGQYAWVGNGVPGTLSQFGPNGSRFVRTVNPNQQETLLGNLVNYHGSLWYLAISSDTIFQLNGTTGHVISQIHLSITDPDVFALINGNIWVASYSTNVLAEINAATGVLIQKRTAPYGGATGSLTVTGNDLWASCGSGPSVGGLWEIDGSTGASLLAVSASKHNLKGFVNIASGGGDIWVANRNKNEVAELDASNGTLVRLITGSDGDLSGPIDVVYRHGDVWVVNEDGNSVSEFDAANGKLIRNLS
jgi:DNA-binding beta-propeller fold protein YncE